MDKTDLIEKVNAYKLANGTDLSSGEDLSIAVMNLVSIEEHLYFTRLKTGRESYSELLNSVRGMRVRLLRELVGQPEGELWCVSKHLLASSMRLIEVGTKHLSAGKRREANQKFQDAFELYSMFWGINLNADPDSKISIADLKSGVHDEEGAKKAKPGFVALVKSILDCCKE